MKRIKIILIALSVSFLLAFSYFFVGWTKPAEDISWGVNFSQKHASSLGLDWQETYLAILDDLGASKIKLGTYWDYIEYDQGNYDFSNLDFLINEAEKRGAEVLPVVGLKSIGWPECHIPQWAKDLSKENQQKAVLKYIEKVVSRYRDRDIIKTWIIENEPFFAFGECPWQDEEFLEKEIALVRSLDDREIMITESGEIPMWFKAARHGDIVGTTMYRKVWSNIFNTYTTFPLPPVFYYRKTLLINLFFDKPVVSVELQAEPWSRNLIYDTELAEQEKTMNPEQFRKNVNYARKTGFDQFYFWGAEWWYWLKKTQNKPEIWEEAKSLIK